MKTFLFFIIPLFFNAHVSFTCTTKVVVTDCDDKPVANATVVLETCKDKKKFAVSTDSNGEASFDLCKSDICRISISYVGYNVKEISNVKDCCKGGTDSVCKIKLCSE